MQSQRKIKLKFFLCAHFFPFWKHKQKIFFEGFVPNAQLVIFPMPENNTFETSGFADSCFCFWNREGTPLSPTFFLWKKLLRNMKQMISCSSFKAFVFSRLLRSSHWRCSLKKGVLRNFAKFTGKRPSQRLFF